MTEDKIKILYLDSSGDDKNLHNLTRAVLHHPRIELTLCEDIEEGGKSFAIQKDGESCSIYTLDFFPNPNPYVPRLVRGI